MKNELTFSDIDSADIYSIYEHDGEKYIKVQGFFYVGDKFHLLTVGGFESRLEDFLQREDGWFEQEYEEHKAWVTDYNTEEEAMEAYNNFFGKVVLGSMKCSAPMPLHFNNLTMETDCGDYISINML